PAATRPHVAPAMPIPRQQLAKPKWQAPAMHLQCPPIGVPRKLPPGPTRAPHATPYIQIPWRSDATWWETALPVNDQTRQYSQNRSLTETGAPKIGFVAAETETPRQAPEATRRKPSQTKTR